MARKTPLRRRSDRYSTTRQSTREAAEYVRSIKKAEGGALNGAELIARTDLTRETLRALRVSFSIVYWTDDQGLCYYPRWQFDAEYNVSPEVRTILGDLHTHDTLHVLVAFLVPAIGEPGVSPLDLIRAGRGGEAVAAIRKRTRRR